MAAVQDVALLTAVWCSDLAECERALHLGGDINTGPQKMTPLFIACREGHIDIVRLLLEADGCNMNKATTDGGATPFYIACHKGHVDIVRLLLVAGGCDTNKARDDGRTPFYIACQGEGMLTLCSCCWKREDAIGTRPRTMGPPR